MSLQSSSTIDHFERHGQLYVPRAHYEFHFDGAGQEQLFKLAEQASRQIIEPLSGDCFYPPIPMNAGHNRAHETIEEVSEYTESELQAHDERLQQEVLGNWDPLELKIGGEVFLGEDGLLFSVEPHDKVVDFRNQVRKIYNLPPDNDHIPHVTRAYSKKCADTSEVLERIAGFNADPAIVSVSALMRLLQWSNGSHYEWNDDARVRLPFGGRK